MLDVQLKEYTRPDHMALEKILMTRVDKINSSADYVRLLSLLYGYYQSLELSISPYLEDSAVSDYTNRRKAFYLLEDMRHHSNEEMIHPLCQHIPDVQSYYAALGVLYVLEGSTLGGKIISKMISGKLHTLAGFNFFTCYGDRAGMMWSVFKTYLNRSFTMCQEKEVLQAAQQTFVTFKLWLDTHE